MNHMEKHREGEPPCEPSANAGSDGASRWRGENLGLSRSCRPGGSPCSVARKDVLRGAEGALFLSRGAALS